LRINRRGPCFFVAGFDSREGLPYEGGTHMRDLGISLLSGGVFAFLLYYRVLLYIELCLLHVSMAIVLRWAQRHYTEGP
jgi:hypothetical protein